MAAGSLTKKRAIFFFGCLELGGAERQGMILAEYMKAALDVAVEVWGFHGPGALAAACESKGIPWRVVRLPLTGRRVGLPARFLRFGRELRKARADILLPYTMTPNVVCCIARQLAGAKVCVWNQRDEGLERQPHWLELLASRSTHAFLANSAGSARFLMEQLGVPRASIRTIHNGVCLPPPILTSREWRARLASDADEYVVAMIANISPLKDHLTLLRAWSQVAGSLQKSARLVIAGNQLNRSRTDELRRLVAALHVEHAVVFLDRVDDVAGLLSAVDLVVHASKSEGLPNAVLEAMYVGKAVVGSDIGGIREALGDGGVYAPVGDEGRLAAAMLAMLRDDDARARLGKLNRLVAQREFSATRMCELTTDFLGSLLTAGMAVRGAVG